MRKWIALILFCTTTAQAITVVQCVGGGQFPGTGNTTAITPTNGNTLIACMSLNTAGNFTSLKDNNGANLTSDSSGFISPGGDIPVRWFRESNVSGVTGVIVALSVSTDWGIVVCEVSGLQSSPLDVVDNTGNANAATTAFLAHSITTTNANDIVTGCFSDGQGVNLTGSGSWLLGGNSNIAGSWATALTYQIVSSATSWQPAATAASSATGSGISSSYKANVASSGGSKKKKLRFYGLL